MNLDFNYSQSVVSDIGIDGKAEITGSSFFSMVETYMKILPKFRKRGVLLQYDLSIEWLGIFLAILENDGVVLPISPLLGSTTVSEFALKNNIPFWIGESNKSCGIYLYEINCKNVCLCSLENQLTEELFFQANAMMVISSSGSFGNAKQIVIGWQQFTHVIKTMSKHLNMEPTDRVLIVTSPQFIQTIWFILASLYAECNIYFYSKFSSSLFFKVHTQMQINYTVAVPSMIQKLLVCLNSGKIRNYIIVGGDVLTASVWQRWRSKHPDSYLVNAYGLSEFSSVAAATPIEYVLDSKGRIGPPIEDVSIKISNNSSSFNKITPRVGEVEVSGPQLMLGYLMDGRIISPGLSKGWLKTGDLGFIDNDGWLTITGRIKNYVNRGGIKVQLEELEEIIFNIIGFKEILVCVYPDDILGQKLVLQAPKYKGMIPLDEVNLNLAKKYGVKNLLSSLSLVDNLTRTESGKPLRYHEYYNDYK